MKDGDVRLGSLAATAHENQPGSDNWQIAEVSGVRPLKSESRQKLHWRLVLQERVNVHE